MRWIEEAHQADPTDAWTLYQRGRLLAARGDQEGARESLMGALDRELAFPDALIALGELAYRAGDHASAELYFERALAVDPARAEVHALRGENLLEQREPALAARPPSRRPSSSTPSSPWPTPAAPGPATSPATSSAPSRSSPSSTTAAARSPRTIPTGATPASSWPASPSTARRRPGATASSAARSRTAGPRKRPPGRRCASRAASW